MDRKVIINIPNKVLPITITATETIGQLKQRLWTTYVDCFEKLDQNEHSFAPMSYQQVVHDDTVLVVDILQWNHLYQVELPIVESVDFSNIDRKAQEQLRTSTIGTQLATNNGKFSAPQYESEIISFNDSTDDEGDDGFDLKGMLSFDPDAPVHPNDTNLKKVQPATLFLVKKLNHKDPSLKGFKADQPYHWMRNVNQKVKGFVTHSYETRFMTVQGYMIFIYKSLPEFLAGKDPVEILHIGGINIYNTFQREDNNNTKYQLVFKSYDVQLQGPNPIAIANALGGESTKNSSSSSSSSTSPQSPSPMNTPKSPTAAGLGGKDEVVLLTPEPFTPNDDIICGAFKRDNVARPPKGISVLMFDDLPTHQSIYKFLQALKYQWLLEISINCATICERRKYWTSEGIFRQSASQQQLEELKQAIYSGCYVDLHSYKDEHLYSGLMKILVRELADGPLMTALYRMWLDVIIQYEKAEKDAGGKEQAAKDPKIAAQFESGVRSVAKRLPYYITNYLSFLFPLLHHVARFHESSRMHYQQLSIVIAPNLIFAPLGRETLQAQADNQRKINALVQKIIDNCYHLFLPIGANTKPLQHIILYSLHEPKYLNSILDDFPEKEIKETETPPRSPSNQTHKQPSFFTPQIGRATGIDIPKESSTTLSTSSTTATSAKPKPHYMNTKHFDPSGGLGGFVGEGDDDQSIAGSYYDSSRILELPIDDSNPLTTNNTSTDSTASSPTNAAPTYSLPPIPLATPEFVEQPSTQQLDDQPNEQVEQQQTNILHALDDEEARQSLIEQQQAEVDAEQLAEYQRIVQEKKEEKEKRDKLINALKIVSPFFNELTQSLEDGLNVSSVTESSLYELLSVLQSVSEQVDYDRQHQI